MVVAIGWDNQIDRSALSAGSAMASLPVTNLKTDDVREIWRPSVNSSYILADFGGQMTFGGTVLVGTNLTITDVVRVRLSTADASGVAGDALDSGSMASGADPTFGMFVFFGQALGRYLRIDISVSAALPEVGRWFAGPIWYPTRNFAYGWRPRWQDPSRQTESQGQVVYTDRKRASRGFSFTLPALTEAEAFDQVVSLNRVAGTSKDIFVCRDAASSNLGRDSVWGLLTAPVDPPQTDFGAFSADFSLRQRI
jgi:hypothetical protein